MQKRKITEILKPEKKEICISVYVDKDGKVIDESKATQKEIQKCEKFVFELAPINYEVTASSLNAMIDISGKTNLMAAGKVIFDACYKGNQGDLEEIQKLISLYSGLCLACSGEAETAYAEFKKK